MGGLSKKAYQFDKIIQEEKLPTIKVDAGSLLFKGATLSLKRAEQERVTAYGIVQSYNLMAYDAVGVSKNDLIAGIPFMKGIVEASNFPWLSANLVANDNNLPLFTPSVVIKKGPLRIGIMALTAPFTAGQFPESAEVHIIAWQDILPELMRELTSQSDLIIFLSNLSSRENHEISKLYPEIRIIVQSGIGSANMSPILVNDSLICQTGKQGKQIGVLKINWQGGKWGSKKPEQLQQQRNNLDRILWQLSKYKKYNNPLEDLQETPNKLRSYQRLLAKKNVLEQKISALAQEIASSSQDADPSTFTNRFIAMETSLPDHLGVVQIIEETNRQINEIGKKLILSRTKQESKYIGSKKCGQCHASQLSIWQESQHAKAYTTLFNKKQHYNLTCLPCHITGSGDIDQGDALNLEAELQGVGCENCHGPGWKHALSPSTNKLQGIPQAAICLKCHTDDHDGSFDYHKDVMIIKH